MSNTMSDQLKSEDRPGFTTLKTMSQLGMAAMATVSISLAQGQEPGVQPEDEQWIDAVLGSYEDSAAPDEMSNDAALQEALDELTAWVYESDLSFGFGRKENLLYSNSNPVDSNFNQIELEFFAMKPGLGHNWEWVGLFFGDVSFYDDAPGFSQEHIAVLHGHAAKRFAGDYKTKFTFEGTKSDQAFDASVNDFETDALTVEVWKPKFEAALQRDFDRWGSLETSLSRAKADYSEVSEDYDETVLGLEWRRDHSNTLQWSFGVELFELDYDQRLARLADGSVIDPAQTLDSDGTEFELAWIYRNKDEVFSRAKTQFTYRTENDGVGEYYGKKRWQVRESLVWQWDLWSLEAGLSYSRLDYTSRLADSETGATREDDTLRGDLRLARELGRDFETYASIQIVDKSSNVDFFSYDSNTYLLGITWRPRTMD